MPDTANFLNNSSFSKILILEDLSFQRNENFLFSNINVSLNSGEILQILGHNGSGKTTLLRLIVSALNLELGKILWQGKNVKNIRESYLENLLFLGHKPGLKGLLSAEENLTWWRSLNKTNLITNSAAFKHVGLNSNKDEPCCYLSAGQLRRAALARLYVSNAKLWVLDEPFASIDKQFSIELKALLISHLDNGGIVLLSTHQNLEIKNMKYISLPYPDKAC